MNNTPWYMRWLSKLLLARNGMVAKCLIAYAKNHPYTHLGDYMERYWIIQHPAKKGEPGYGTFRNWLRYLMPFYVRLHWIQRPDAGRDLHDHPFWFKSIILAGWYMEERRYRGGSVGIRFLKEGQVNECDPGDYHRIVNVGPEGALTLVIHGRKRAHSWGFLVDGEHVHWKTYHENKLLDPALAALNESAKAVNNAMGQLKGALDESAEAVKESLSWVSAVPNDSTTDEEAIIKSIARGLDIDEELCAKQMTNFSTYKSWQDHIKEVAKIMRGRRCSDIQIPGEIVKELQ